MALHQHVSSMMETKDFTELLIDSRMKFVNISGFSLIILVGVFDYWDALCSFIRLNYFSICFNLTSIKLKTPFPLHLVMFECFFYLTHFNPIQDRLFRDCSRMWWAKKAPSPKNLSQISCNDETWHSYILPKEDAKKIWITWHTPWVLLTSAFFQRKSNFPISKNTDIDCILIHHFYLF